MYFLRYLRCNLHRFEYCSTDNIEAALARCDEFLSSTNVPSKNWETRMVNLSSSWDNNRKLLLEALLNCESLPSPDHCGICLEGKTLIRCHDCPKKFFCSLCDGNVHSLLPFHNRDGFVGGFFQAIPPTVTIDENGVKQNIGKQISKGTKSV